MSKTYKSALPEITLKWKSGEVKKQKITCSQDIVDILRQVFDEDTLELNESFIAVYLNRANNTIGWFKVSQGGISGTVADPKLILGTALKCAASNIIIAHNHPSGNAQPSDADKSITRKIKQGAEILDMGFLDHIIITSDSYYSFADEGGI